MWLSVILAAAIVSRSAALPQLDLPRHEPRQAAAAVTTVVATAIATTTSTPVTTSAPTAAAAPTAKAGADAVVAPAAAGGAGGGQPPTASDYNPDPSVPMVTVYYLASEIAPGNIVEVPYTFTQTFGSDPWTTSGAGTVDHGTATATTTTGLAKAQKTGTVNKAATNSGSRADGGAADWRIGVVVGGGVALGGVLLW